MRPGVARIHGQYLVVALTLVDQAEHTQDLSCRRAIFEEP